MIIPSKPPSLAKRRLAFSLTEKQVRELHLSMLEDVLSVAVTVRGLSGICLVTICPEISALGRRYGALVLNEPAMRGHKEAVILAANHLQRNNIDQFMTLPGDIPLVTPRDIETVLAAHCSRNTMTLVPDYCSEGANCIILTPDTIPALRIGSGKFSTHIHAADALGFNPRIIQNPNIAQDIDTPDDLLILLNRGQNTLAGTFLLEIEAAGQHHRAEKQFAGKISTPAIVEIGP